jgi:hypothetical protein
MKYIQHDTYRIVIPTLKYVNYKMGEFDYEERRTGEYCERE